MKKIQEFRYGEQPINICAETDVTFIPLIGRIVELDDYKEKDRKKNEERKPFWINPCCGQIDHYQQIYWGANDYQCKMCRKKEDDKFHNASCQNCHKALKKNGNINPFEGYFNGFKLMNIILCKSCFDKNGIKVTEE